MYMHVHKTPGRSCVQISIVKLVDIFAPLVVPYVLHAHVAKPTQYG